MASANGARKSTSIDGLLLPSHLIVEAAWRHGSLQYSRCSSLIRQAGSSTTRPTPVSRPATLGCLPRILLTCKATASVRASPCADGIAPLSQNEYLVLAGTFHGIHAIASRISPIEKSSGVEVIEAESFKMTCLQTPTGALSSLGPERQPPDTD